MTASADELSDLAAALAARRAAVLEAWRDAVRRDPRVNSGNAMSRSELNDHIPALLEAFDRDLRGLPAAARTAANAEAHGLHRWQQGYDLREVTRELGRLNECMTAELDRHASAHSGLSSATMAEARLRWARACTVAVGESAAQFFRLQQLEVAGHMDELEGALADLNDLERQRAELWQQAAHDLRGNVGIVSNATAGLVLADLPAAARDRFLQLLQRNVGSLLHLLDDVTGLARLQAGQERRVVAPFDAATSLQELCEGLVQVASQRGLYLRYDGPATLPVEGDAVKMRRIAQNLILNALAYTRVGGVTVRWGDGDPGDEKRWRLSVQDTGPGLQTGSAPLTEALHAATRLQTDAQPDATRDPEGTRDALDAVPQADDGNLRHGGTGEGLGLSIVKRLCELLDAAVEVDTDSATGARFRILFPRRYAAA